ncbi:MAG TPA: TetR family transcriptional regulator [Rhodopila sp.]|jgi:AcrR family transcriptional regulator
MRYSPEHSEQTRQRILDAAGREFRNHGFAGIGVDGLAKAAGVTSGAFYSHFRSKADVFRAVAAAGLARLRLGMEHFRRQHGRHWLEPFATFYLGSQHRADIPGGCAMPALSAEVERADETTRSTFQEELLKVATLAADGWSGQPGREAGWPILAMLAGGVLLSRAVANDAVAQEIADAVLTAVKSYTAPAHQRGSDAHPTAEALPPSPRDHPPSGAR